LKLDPESLSARILVAFGFRLLQVWSHTIRFEVDDRGKILEAPGSERFIGALWHNRLLLLPFAIRRFIPQRQGAALISASRDGAWLSKLVRRFGFSVVRGSSSRKGAAAMLQLADVIASGHDIVPLNLECSRCWRLASWDRFILPRPFTRVRFILGPPHQVRATSSEEEFEGERERLRAAMMAQVEMR